MRKRKKQVMEENISRSLLITEGRYLDLIPVDLVINNILSRLPTKSIAQCRCLSKHWSLKIRRQNYNLLFPIKSSHPPPRFLFTFLVERTKLIFFSSPQLQNPVNNLSLVATRHLTNCIVTEDLVYKLCRPVEGLVCCQHIGKNYTFAVLSNPITGECVTLPKLMTEETESYAECYFGYDPIENQFKVLCVIWFLCQTYNKWCIEHHILTLETENLFWRKIQCCKPYVFLNSLDGICIDGVLYYTAKAETKHDKRMIVSFDVNTEKFRFINIDKDLATKIHRDLVQINYKGKLCIFIEGGWYDPFELWVLEDAEEHKWSKHVYKTTLHREVLNATSINSAGVIGVTDSGDVVLCQKYALENHFSISYYNLESKVMVRVRVDIPEFNALKSLRFYATPNYMEYMKLM